MAKYPPLNVPFVQAQHHGGKQTPSLIVLHSTVTSSVKGAALGVANWWHSAGSPTTSAHYVVDEATTIQCVYDHVIAYHCGYNDGSLAFEMCDDPSDGIRRWNDQPHKNVLYRTADGVATQCLAYGIPARYLTDAQLLAWGKSKKASNGGIVTHAQMSRVFKMSSHWDPGDWPSQTFLKMVQEMIKEKSVPVPTKKKIRMRITTANFKSFPTKMSPAAFWQSLMSVFGDQLIGLQECDPPEYKQAIFKKYPQALGIGTPQKPNNDTYSCPLIPGKRGFEVVSSGAKKLYNGEAGISKTRHLTHARLRHKKKGLELAAVNLHSVVVKEHKRAQRLAMRANAKAVTLQTVRGYLNLGLPVAITGDFNDVENWFGSEFEGRRVQRSGKGIDQIILINGEDLKWTIKSESREDTPSDHDTRTVVAELIEK